MRKIALLLYFGFHNMLEVSFGLWIKIIIINVKNSVLKPRIEINLDNRDYSRVLIVIQGTIITKRNFTLNTIIYYKTVFPKANIVVSCWSDDNKVHLSKIKGLNVNVIINDKPEFFGIKKRNFDSGISKGNTNLQIISTQKGILLAEKIGCEYVVKTRSDARILDEDSLEKLFILINTFPLMSEINNQKSRLIVYGNTSKYYPFRISDLFMFGELIDMKNFWDAPLQKDEYFDDNDPFFNWYNKCQSARSYLFINFLNNIGFNYIWDMNNYKFILGNRFCVIDHSIFEYYWPKYRHLSISEDSKNENFTFSDWLLLYGGNFKF